MLKRQILFLFGSSLATILITMGASFYYQSALEKQAQVDISNLPTHLPFTISPNYAKALDISRKLIAKMYDYTPYANGYVLGEQSPVVLKQEEIADISTPTVVRIFNQVKGTVTLPEFTVDLLNLKFIPTGTNYTGNAQATVSGTGFFVDSAGHILTNAHVASKHIIIDSFTDGALDYYGEVIRNQINNLSEHDAALIEQKLIAEYGPDPQTAGFALALDLLSGIEDYIAEKSTIKAEQTLTVLDPSQSDISISSEDDLINLANSSIPATVIASNDDYLTTHKDVALIKIEQNATPFLSLDAENKGTAGQQIYIIGYPQSAELNTADLFSKSVTQGTISSVREEDDIKVYQTDAKIATGSSGSPMINSNGDVIGIVSFLTTGGIGDNFGFAIPIEHAVALMDENNISPNANPYVTSFTSGVNLAAQDLCRKANEQFSLSQSLNQTFNNPNLQKYIDLCNKSIAAGTSKDGFIYQVQEKIKSTPLYIWGGAFALLLISITTGVLLWRSRRNQIIPQNSTPAPIIPT